MSRRPVVAKLPERYVADGLPWYAGIWTGSDWAGLEWFASSDEAHAYARGSLALLSDVAALFNAAAEVCS